MFRLFTRAQWARTRRFADAGRDPPLSPSSSEAERGRGGCSSSLEVKAKRLGGTNSRNGGTLEAEAAEPRSAPERPDNLDIERQLYRPMIHSSSSGSAGVGSGGNGNGGSDHGAGNASSEPLPLGSHSRSRNGSLTPSAAGGSDGGGSGSTSRRASGQFVKEWPEGYRDEDSSDFEQSIAIVNNPRASSSGGSRRRTSLADMAFPELHSGGKSGRSGSSSGGPGGAGGPAAPEPEHLLILTRTRTDRHGRRHSVSVPLVPPPEGERFEGGYHVERNPITGALRLMAPQAGASSGAESSSGGLRPHPQRSFRERRSLRDKSPRPRGAVATAATAEAAQAARKASTSGAGTSRSGRRHSIQQLQVPPPGGTPNPHQLAREMERLKISGGSGAGAGGSGAGAGGSRRESVSPRPLRRKASSSRRGSKATKTSILHFLDLAIAN